MEQAGVGRHTICELWDAEHLDSAEVVEQALRDAAGVTCRETADLDAMVETLRAAPVRRQLLGI